MRLRDLASKASALFVMAALFGGCGGSTTPGDACPASGECSADQFCDYQYNWCGTPPSGEDTPVCHLRTGDCDNALPVCGCDRKVYPSECAAHEAGVDIGGANAGQELCAHDLTPAGTFACGPFFCAAAGSYCAYGDGDTGDRSTVCKPLPQACGGTGSCNCMTLSSQDTCSEVEGNGVKGVLVVTVLL